MRSVRPMVMLVAALAVATGACATTSGSQALVQPVLTADELEPYHGLTVYEFLRRHTKVVFFDRSGGAEVVYTYSYGGSASLTQGGARPSVLRVNGQEVLSPVQELQAIPIEQVQRLEILKATEYSARYGGPGRRGGIILTTRGENPR